MATAVSSLFPNLDSLSPGANVIKLFTDISYGFS
jgi:hypothetical protein